MLDRLQVLTQARAFSSLVTTAHHQLHVDGVEEGQGTLCILQPHLPHDGRGGLCL